MQGNPIVSQDQWLDARRAFLVKEKAHMRAGDMLAKERRALPWMKLEKAYVFDTDHGRKTLADLSMNEWSRSARAYSGTSRVYSSRSSSGTFSILK